jgi:hypothetical protein
VIDLRQQIQGWQRLREQTWPRELAGLRAMAAAQPPRPRNVVRSLGALLYNLVPLAGSELAADVEFLRPVAAAAVREADKETPAPARLPWTTLRVVDLVGALQAVGHAIDAEVVRVVRAWLPRIDVNRDDPDTASRYWALGSAALALDVREVYYRIAGVNADGAMPYTAGQSFAANQQGLLRHLAGAVEAGASLPDVMPAWDSFLAAYPALREAQEADPAGLLWTARVIHHRIGGGDPAGAADFLHDSIWQAAGLS